MDQIKYCTRKYNNLSLFDMKILMVLLCFVSKKDIIFKAENNFPFSNFLASVAFTAALCYVYIAYAPLLPALH